MLHRKVFFRSCPNATWQPSQVKARTISDVSLDQSDSNSWLRLWKTLFSSGFQLPSGVHKQLAASIKCAAVRCLICVNSVVMIGSFMWDRKIISFVVELGGELKGGRGAGADDNTVATPYILYFVKVVGFCFITFYNGCIGSGLQIQIYPTKCFYIYSLTILLVTCHKRFCFYCFDLDSFISFLQFTTAASAQVGQIQIYLPKSFLCL